ncbi:MAG: MoaD/ThiS family protein [Bacteroidetes bacterium]|nr:MoaD/ThiS family protein [Bacteroidota bacterium]
MAQTSKIRAFGMLAERLGAIEIETPVFTDSVQLEVYLREKYPVLRELPYILAVDLAICSEKTDLSPDSVVALLPPFAGG